MTKITFVEDVSARTISIGNWFVSENRALQEKTLWQLVQTAVNQVQLINVNNGNRARDAIKVYDVYKLTVEEFKMINTYDKLIPVSVEISVSKYV